MCTVDGRAAAAPVMQTESTSKRHTHLFIFGRESEWLQSPKIARSCVYHSPCTC